jgi:hypothetical protein
VAKLVLTNANVKVNGTDFSDHIAAVTIEISADEVETTAFGQSTRTRVGGLKDGSIQLDWHQDFTASVDAFIAPLVGQLATVVVLPNGTGAGTANPSYSGEYLVSGYSPIAGAVGDLLTFSTTWPTAGTAGIVRATS